MADMKEPKLTKINRSMVSLQMSEGDVVVMLSMATVHRLVLEELYFNWACQRFLWDYPIRIFIRSIAGVPGDD